jgi:hypothetical protein
MGEREKHRVTEGRGKNEKNYYKCSPRVWRNIDTTSAQAKHTGGLVTIQ